MSRLIRDTDLIDEIDEMIECAEGYYNQDRHEGYLAALEWVKKLINETKSAYDVETVVKELEDIARSHARRQIECEDKQWSYLADQHKYYVRAFDETIAIVKRGGRNGN